MLCPQTPLRRGASDWASSPSGAAALKDGRPLQGLACDFNHEQTKLPWDAPELKKTTRLQLYVVGFSSFASGGSHQMHRGHTPELSSICCANFSLTHASGSGQQRQVRKTTRKTLQCSKAQLKLFHAFPIYHAQARCVDAKPKSPSTEECVPSITSVRTHYYQFTNVSGHQLGASVVLELADGGVLRAHAPLAPSWPRHPC